MWFRGCGLGEIYLQPGCSLYSVAALSPYNSAVHFSALSPPLFPQEPQPGAAVVNPAGDDDGGEQEGRLTESVAASRRPQVSQMDRLGWGFLLPIFCQLSLPPPPPPFHPPGPIMGAVNLPVPSSSPAALPLQRSHKLTEKAKEAAAASFAVCEHESEAKDSVPPKVGMGSWTIKGGEGWLSGRERDEWGKGGWFRGISLRAWAGGPSQGL